MASLCPGFSEKYFALYLADDPPTPPLWGLHFDVDTFVEIEYLFRNDVMQTKPFRLF